MKNNRTRLQDYVETYNEGFKGYDLAKLKNAITRDNMWYALRSTLSEEQRNSPRLKLAFRDGWNDADDRGTGDVPQYREDDAGKLYVSWHKECPQELDAPVHDTSGYARQQPTFVARLKGAVDTQAQPDDGAILRWDPSKL